MSKKTLRVPGGKVNVEFIQDIPKAVSLDKQIENMYYRNILPLDTARVAGKLPKLTKGKEENLVFWIAASIRDLQYIKEDLTKDW
tara:strand:+ start:100 stop:354 length:255 start_codon:yes stop_codon:yes gene_type:complete